VLLYLGLLNLLPPFKKSLAGFVTLASLAAF
jgi:hypothetical protein